MDKSALPWNEKPGYVLKQYWYGVRNLKGIACGDYDRVLEMLRTDYGYEKALALLKLGRKAEAKAIGEAMVKKGSVVLGEWFGAREDTLDPKTLPAVQKIDWFRHWVK